MSFKTSFIAELKSESANTKKMLERVPLDKADWKPHEKSMSIGRLATHTSELTRWVYTILEANEFDFATSGFKPYVASSTEELMDIFNGHFNKAIASLEKANDEEFEKMWTVKRAGKLFSQCQKKQLCKAGALIIPFIIADNCLFICDCLIFRCRECMDRARMRSEAKYSM